MKTKKVIGITIPTAMIFAFSPKYSLVINEIMLEKDEIEKEKSCTAREAYSIMLESKIREIEEKEAEIKEIESFSGRIKARFLLAYLEEEKGLLETLLD